MDYQVHVLVLLYYLDGPAVLVEVSGSWTRLQSSSSILDLWNPRLSFVGQSSPSNRDSPCALELQYPLLEGPKAFWLVIFFVGALSEELWRVFCIAATYETKRDVTDARIWSSISFAVGRLGGLPGRIHTRLRC